MTHRKALIVSALALAVTTCSAYGSSAGSYEASMSDELMEAFIGLRVGKGGSSFYRVMVDNDENPYIAIHSFMTHWFGLNPECNNDRVFCSITLPGESSPRWIDGENHSMSSPEEKEVNLNPRAMILKDDVIWLEYRALEKWLPLRAVWSLKSYQMSINPFFKLPQDIISQRSKSREGDIKKKEERRKGANDSVLVVPHSGNEFYEARGEIKTTAFSDKDLSTEFSYDIGVDFYGGNLQAGGVSSEQGNEVLDYFRYERFDNPTGDYFALGQIFYEGSLIESPRVLTEGYQFVRHYQREGVGSFTLNATVPEEATVDVYKNGFYEETLQSNKLGEIILTDIQASSGDIITLKSITKEGYESEERIKISGANTEYLSANDWDYKITGGSDNEGSIHSLSLKYGLASNFTAGLTIQNSSTESEHETTTLSSFSYRPYHKLSLQWQQEVGENNWAYSSNINMGLNNSLRIFGQNVENNDSDFWNSDFNSFHGAEQSLGFSRIQLQTRFINSKSERNLRERIGIKLRSKWDMRLEGERSWLKYEKEIRDSWEMRHLYALSNGSKIEAGIGESDSFKRWFAGFKWLGDTESPWSDHGGKNRYSLSANIQSINSSIEPSISLNWYHGEAISGTISGNSEQWKAEARWKFGLAKKTGKNNERWGRQLWEDFGQGTVKGRLTTPPTGDLKASPLSDVTILISNKKATTDANGNFEIQGLPVNQVIYGHIDSGSLPINLMAKKKKWRLNLRPGTVLKIEPKTVWSVGIDGFVEKDTFAPGMQMTFSHKVFGEMTTVSVEHDGFFIAERLVPGEYTVSLKYRDKEPESISLTLNDNEVWVSDVEINAKKEIEKKAPLSEQAVWVKCGSIYEVVGNGISDHLY